MLVSWRVVGCAAAVVADCWLSSCDIQLYAIGLDDIADKEVWMASGVSSVRVAWLCFCKPFLLRFLVENCVYTLAWPTTLYHATI